MPVVPPGRKTGTCATTARGPSLVSSPIQVLGRGRPCRSRGGRAWPIQAAFSVPASTIRCDPGSSRRTAPIASCPRPRRERRLLRGLRPARAPPDQRLRGQVLSCGQHTAAVGPPLLAQRESQGDLVPERPGGPTVSAQLLEHGAQRSEQLRPISSGLTTGRTRSDAGTGIPWPPPTMTLPSRCASAPSPSTVIILRSRGAPPTRPRSRQGRWRAR